MRTFSAGLWLLVKVSVECQKKEKFQISLYWDPSCNLFVTKMKRLEAIQKKRKRNYSQQNLHMPYLNSSRKLCAVQLD